MKTFLSILSAAALAATTAYAEPMMNQSQMHNEMQNRYQKMSTDELLNMRGQMHNQQERDQLHNELMMREKKMTKEQKEKFSRMPGKVSNQMGTQEKGMGYGQGQGMMQGNVPEKNSQEMGKQGKGNAYGEGQGMMQGQHKGMGYGKEKNK